MHVPSTMSGGILSNDQSLIFAVVPSIVAGASATTDVEAHDRDRVCNIGSYVGSIIFDIGFFGVTAEGMIEYLVFKLERKLVTPTVGVDTVPSDADVISVGLQQAWRIDNPGRVMKFGIMPVSPELPSTRSIKVNPGKFKMAKIRPGDFIGIVLFNRTGATITSNVQMRYKATI